MADHQQIKTIGFTAGVRNGSRLGKGQDLAVVGRHHLHPRVIVEKQGAIAPVEVVLRQRTHAAPAQ